MSNKVKIAIDAMSGENSPNKIIDGIEISLRSKQENFFYLFGQKDLLEKKISRNKLMQKYCEIINTKDIILDDESPLGAAKRGKESSMWKAIESLREKKDSYISICWKHRSNVSYVKTPFKNDCWY
jgi:glycerol-3-phosphate acyltransferase PlsX